MTVEQHDLTRDFLAFRGQIHHRKLDNRRFAALYQAYQQACLEEPSVDQEFNPPCDIPMEGFKRKRVPAGDTFYSPLFSPEYA